MVIKSAENSIHEYAMLRPGDHVLVALSGGADSVALLHFLWSQRERYGITLAAAHVNHGLRGEDSRHDRFFSEGFCQRLGIPFFLLETDIAAKARETGEGIEECGRRVRYAFFESIEADKIATAHHLGDQAETILLNLIRGTGLRGLCGIPPVRGKIIRPFIATSREEILEYLTLNHLDWREDLTNASPAYKRNVIRHAVLPKFEELSPAFSENLLRMSRRLTRDADFLDSLAAKVLESVRRPEGYAAQELLQAPEPLRSRALLMLCRQHGIPCQSLHVELMEETLLSGMACTLPGGMRFCCSQGLCRIVESATEEDSKADFVIPLAPGQWNLPSGKLKIRRIEPDFQNQPKKFNNLLFKNSIDCGMIGFNPVIRTRKPGDRLRMPGRGLSKPLRKLYNEKGVPAAIRDRLPVIADDTGLLWAAGFGPDQRAVPGRDTRELLLIEFESDDEIQY